MMLRYCGVLAVIASIGFAIGVAEEKKQPSIIGNWEAKIPEAKALNLVLTFQADGKFIQELAIGKVPKMDNVKLEGDKKEGTYKLVGRKITATISGKDEVYTIKEVSEQKLTLANDKDVDLTFTKKKQ